MKGKKILAAIDAATKEIITAIETHSAVKKTEKPEKAEKKPKRRKLPDGGPLCDQFTSLADMLDSPAQPSRYKIMTIVAPLVDALEKEVGIADGLFDLLSPDARKSVVMLFLYHMLKDADEQAPKPDYPDKVPLDISDGDNIPNRVMEGQVPYNKKPRGKLDRGF